MATSRVRTARPELARLWEAFARDRGNVELRRRIAEHYVEFVRLRAQVFAAKVPGLMTVDDLVGPATEGLLQAIDRFDPGRGYQFTTYAQRRVDGAIQDEMRAQDPVGRLDRKQARDLDERRRGLTMAAGRPATDEELQEAGLSLRADEIARLSTVGVVSLETISVCDEDRGPLVAVPDEKEPPPHWPLGRTMFVDHLLRGLSIEEKIVVYLYYFKQRTMKEIGAILHLSESRVSQMHSHAMALLRETNDRCEAFEAAS